jgi:hypothetical protein
MSSNYINPQTGHPYSNEIIFCYNAPSGTMVQDATPAIPITIASDSDFLLREIKTMGTAGVTFQLTLTDGTAYSSAPLSSAAVAASANGVNYRDKCIIIPKATQLKCNFNNTSSSNANDEVQLWGLKLIP